MAKVFPEITMKGMGVELKLYPFEESSAEEGKTSFSVLIDDGYSTVCIGRTDSYEIATEIMQCYMTACAALGFELDSVN